MAASTVPYPPPGLPELRRRADPDPALGRTAGLEKTKGEHPQKARHQALEHGAGGDSRSNPPELRQGPDPDPALGRSAGLETKGEHPQNARHQAMEHGAGGDSRYNPTEPRRQPAPDLALGRTAGLETRGKDAQDTLHQAMEHGAGGDSRYNPTEVRRPLDVPSEIVGVVQDLVYDLVKEYLARGEAVEADTLHESVLDLVDEALEEWIGLGVMQRDEITLDVTSLITTGGTLRAEALHSDGELDDVESGESE